MENLLWCIHIDAPLYCLLWKSNYWQQPSLHGRDMQGNMAVGFFHQALIFMT